MEKEPDMDMEMKPISELLEKELERLKRLNPIGARPCMVCDEMYYEDEMRHLTRWTCFPCLAGQS
jgi:formylmethanofuran dehydrogenase subunit E